MALSVVLLVCAGLLVRSLQAVREVHSGMDGATVRVAYPKPRPQAYARIDNDAYYPQLVERISRVPGIDAVSVSLLKPAAGGGGSGTTVAPMGDTLGGRRRIGADPGRTRVLPRAGDTAATGTRFQLGRRLA